MNRRVSTQRDNVLGLRLANTSTGDDPNGERGRELKSLGSQLFTSGLHD